MLRSRRINEPGASEKEETLGPMKRRAGPIQDEAKRKRGGLSDLSNVMSNTLHIDSAKVTKIASHQRILSHPEGKKSVATVGGAENHTASEGQASQKPRLALPLETLEENTVGEECVNREVAEEQVDLCPDFDFDLENADNENMVPGYASSIFQYYKHREKSFRIGDYLSRQPSFLKVSRARLVNWLVEVQQDFELSHETFYTAVKIVDHFLDKTNKHFGNKHLYLLGSSAIFIAAKFEEKFAPSIEELIYETNKMFSDFELKYMERLMLDTVRYDIGYPLAYSFLRRYAKVLSLDMSTLTLARYYLEACSLFYEYVGVRDSLMASACLLLALRVKRLGDWDNKLIKYAGYRLAEVEPLMWTINHAVPMRSELYPDLFSVSEKYGCEVFYKVAAYPLLPDRFGSTDPIGPPVELSFSKN